MTDWRKAKDAQNQMETSRQYEDLLARVCTREVLDGDMHGAAITAGQYASQQAMTRRHTEDWATAMAKEAT